MANAQSYQSQIDKHECELPIDSTTGLIYEEIITEVSGASEKELYTRFKFWSATAFKSLPDVLKLDDPENGTIIIKGQFDFLHEIKIGIASTPSGSIWHGYFTMTANFKDGKYRVIIKDFGILSTDYSDLGNPVIHFHPWKSKSWENAMMKKAFVNSGIITEKRFMTELTNIKKSLIEGMKKQSSSKSDW